MQKRRLGKTDMYASKVALGTWAIGGGPWWGNSDENTSIRAIQESLDRGVNFIDTAPAYGLGRSEEVVGKAIKGRRENVLIATKCGIWWGDDKGVMAFEVEGTVAYKNLSPRTIRLELESSLRRLGTDYVDLYQTHWPVVEEGNYQLSDTIQCLADMQSEGKIRAIGASNVSIDEMKEYESAGVLDTIQPKYSMLDRANENVILPFCKDHGVSTLVYSPLEQGLLTGSIGMDYVVDDNSSRNGIPWFKLENRRRVLDMLSSWADLTDKYNCTSAQLVIAWTLAQSGVTYALCGARNPEHAISNTIAGDLVLDTKDIELMRSNVEQLGSPK